MPYCQVMVQLWVNGLSNSFDFLEDKFLVLSRLFFYIDIQQLMVNIKKVGNVVLFYQSWEVFLQIDQNFKDSFDALT